MVPGQESSRHLRIFFIPFFAKGHLIPTVDAARLFASRGIEPTIVVTPANGAVIRRTLDKANVSGRQINILFYPFPSTEVGLPEGKENLSSVLLSESKKIDKAVLFVRDSVSQILRENRPDCIISDIHFFWTNEVAKELGIPRVVFSPIGVFSPYVMSILNLQRPFMHAADDAEPFIVPGLPHQIEILRHEVPDIITSTAQENDFWKQVFQARKESYGVLVHTFYELESSYTHLYEKTVHRRAWYVGPLALSYEEDDDAGKMERGGGGGVGGNHEKCISWLETKTPRSVVFMCFGSWCHFSREQLREMALGLEASGHAFLWVVREEEAAGGPEWLPEGFEERVDGKGLVVRGWVPQVLVLNHPSVGAFITHCGWNSVLEGVCAGVPMVTWPLYFEQFINEKLVVQVLKIGVRLTRVVVGEEEEVTVKGEDIARVVAVVMDGGEEVKAMRRRVREYREMARLALKEGGSSCNNLNRLIEELKMWAPPNARIAA